MNDFSRIRKQLDQNEYIAGVLIETFLDIERLIWMIRKRWTWT